MAACSSFHIASTWEDQLIHCRAGLPFRGLEEQANRNIMQFNRDKCGVLCMGRKTPGNNPGLPAEKDPGLVSHSKLDRSQQHALAAERATSTLGCMNRSPANRPREVIIPHWPAPSQTTSTYRIQFWLSQSREDIDKPG